MIRDIISYNQTYKDVEIVEEEDLPRGCGEIDYITEEETFERFIIYKDCMTKLLYAVKEEE